MRMNVDTNLDVMKRPRCPPWFSSESLNIELFGNGRLRMLQYYKQMFYLAWEAAHVEGDNGIESSPDGPRKLCAAIKKKKEKKNKQFVPAVLLLCRQRELRPCLTFDMQGMNMAHMWPVEPERKQKRNLVSDYTAPCGQLLLYLREEEQSRR